VQQTADHRLYQKPRYQPFLKWAGGKSWLLRQYAELFPESANVYYEPFVGSGAVFYYLRGHDFAKRYILSDANPELINVYQMVKQHLSDLLEHLRDHKQNHGEEHYYTVRRLDRNGTWESMGDIQRAARMIYLNRTCYNGLWRVNSKGQFNVPIGSYKNPRIVNEKRLKAAAEALRAADVCERSFETVVDEAQPGDFVYFDPPYVPLNRTSSFTAYSRENFTDADQAVLAEVFRQLDGRGVKVMLSNSDTESVRELYAGFDIRTVKARRAINTDGSKRGHINEVVVRNY